MEKIKKDCLLFSSNIPWFKKVCTHYITDRTHFKMSYGILVKIVRFWNALINFNKKLMIHT